LDYPENETVIGQTHPPYGDVIVVLNVIVTNPLSGGEAWEQDPDFNEYVTPGKIDPIDQSPVMLA